MTWIWGDLCLIVLSTYFSFCFFFLFTGVMFALLILFWSVLVSWVVGFGAGGWSIFYVSPVGAPFFRGYLSCVRVLLVLRCILLPGLCSVDLASAV